MNAHDPPKYGTMQPAPRNCNVGFNRDRKGLAFIEALSFKDSIARTNLFIHRLWYRGPLPAHAFDIVLV